MRKLFIPILSISLIIGCILAFTIDISNILIAYLIIFFSILSLLYKNNIYALFIFIFLIGIFLGFLRVTIFEKNINNEIYLNYTGKVEITGTIKSDIENKESYSRYTLEVHEIMGEKIKNTSIIVYEPYPTNCVTGEKITIYAELKEPKNFDTDTGRVFKYKQHLKQFDIYAVTSIYENPCVSYVHEYDIFSSYRDFLVSKFSSVLPDREASLLGGLLLGLRGSISSELLTSFRITGLIHIIVLSGYNVMIIAEAVRRLLNRLKNKNALIFSILFVILFVLLSGAQVAAVRAGSMAVISLFAKAFNREYDGINILLFVAALMVLYNPAQVLFSNSFHMSFLATLGLLLFSPYFESLFSFVTNRFQIRGIVSVTIATQIFLLPYLIYAIGEISLIGTIANILILPLIPIAMALGAIVMFVAIISQTIAHIISPIAYIPLNIIINLTEIFAKIPYAAVRLPEIEIYTLFILYIPLIYLGFYLCKKYKKHEVKELI